MPILVVLAGIKGLVLSLVVIFALLMGGALIYVLVRSHRPTLSILCVGLVECILISVPLFCGRHLCEVALATRVIADSKRVELRPSGLFPPGVEMGPGSVGLGGLYVYSQPLWSIEFDSLLRTVGVVDPLESSASRRPVARDSLNWSLVGFDHTRGLLVYSFMKTTLLYVGPKGFSGVPEKWLGRFVSPIFDDGVLYDRGTMRFCTIDIEGRTIHWGEKVQDGSWEPAYIFPRSYEPRLCWVRIDYVPSPYEVDRNRYVAVLDRSGRIALLDRQTLNIFQWAGRLPRPRTFFGHGSGQPRDILDYHVALLAAGPEGQYAGMVVGSLSRQGTSMTLAVFGKDGDEIRTRDSDINPPNTPGELALMIGKYFFESSHPPALTLASFFTAHSFEAGATHRALFLMPNSFVALQRDRETSFAFQLLAAFLFLLPALAFAGFLSWRVVRDAAVMGLSRKARGLWGLGTLAFGLPAYITYRLTRPRVALALCRDCGRGRRVDREVCHYCGSGWERPVLNPPAWRVTSP